MKIATVDKVHLGIYFQNNGSPWEYVGPKCHIENKCINYCN